LARTWFLTILIFLLQPIMSGAADRPPSDPADRVLTIYPVTSGTFRSSDRPISKVVVLAMQTGPSIDAVRAAAKEVFVRGGITVIDQTPSSRPGGTHGPATQDRSNADPSILALGKRAGADHIMLLEVTDTLVLEAGALSGTAYLHDERVSVTGLSVNTGRIVLEGTARWSQPIERAGQHIRELTTYAIARAICTPADWVEASEVNHGRGKCRR
jgi:hypothetical protein